MSQVATAKANSTRAKALERRKAMSVGGKAALKLANSNAAPVRSENGSFATQPALARTGAGGNAREVSLARRKAMSSHGKVAAGSQDRTRMGSRQSPAKIDTQTGQLTEKGCGCGCGGAKKDACVNRDKSAPEKPMSAMPKVPVVRTPKVATSSSAKVAALARRKALSTYGKAGAGIVAVSDAQVARASNPKLSSRELAKDLREQRSKNGNAGQEKSVPCGRQRQTIVAGAVEAGPAQDASWKVGSSVTVSGQTVTGTMVGRKENMTGNEPSTCRAITGTEYLGADIFNKFCQTGPRATTAKKVEVTSTSRGNMVSGNRMGSGTNVTGNKSGECQRMTGNEYTSAEQSQHFCGDFSKPTPSISTSMAQTMKGRNVSGDNVGRTENVTGNEYGMRRHLTGTQYMKSENIGYAPDKVTVSNTLRGGSITGTAMGRREQMTGDEYGSCKDVTGDDYASREQFGKFCKSTPNPTDSKIAVSQTIAGLKVTGDLAQRSQIVTGDEPGTCKATTGTPYAGRDQYQTYCDEPQANAAQARMQPSARMFGKPMTGQQPGIGGKLTGAGKGACDPISGTPYVGSDQVAGACPSVAVEEVSQAADAPWLNFSVKAPIHAAQHDGSFSHVTGSRYESGHITGSFGKGVGKLTGTEEARFDGSQATQLTTPTFAVNVDGRVKSRVTGEGMEAGLNITGDDWDRGDHVTGTEGASATQRNLTRRGGGMSAMQMRADMMRPEDVPVPVSKVTGGSGNTEKGSLITYSGGARG